MREETAVWHHSLAWHHGYHGYESHWLGHTIVSSLIHGLIYGAIFRLFERLPLGLVLMLAVLGVAVVAVGWWWWTRRSGD